MPRLPYVGNSPHGRRSSQQRQHALKALFKAFAEIWTSPPVGKSLNSAPLSPNAARNKFRAPPPFGKRKPAPAIKTKKSRSLRRDRSGTAAIEFALVFPIFLLVFLGIVGCGIYIGASHSVAQLAADAARASVAGLSDVERASIAQGTVAANASSYPLLIANKIVVTAAPIAADTSEFRVSVSYDSSALPIWGFTNFVPMPSKTITRSATVKRGGY